MAIATDIGAAIAGRKSAMTDKPKKVIPLPISSLGVGSSPLPPRRSGEALKITVLATVTIAEVSTTLSAGTLMYGSQSHSRNTLPCFEHYRLRQKPFHPARFCGNGNCLLCESLR